MSASTRTTYTSPAGSVEVDSLTAQILGVANQILALPRFGGEVEPMTATQGSYRPKTPYSGTTHMGCAAVDLTAYNWRNRLQVLDLLGNDAMHRLKTDGDWPEHLHCMTRGMACASDALKGQIAEVRLGGDGLAGNAPDRDKKLRSGLWTLAVYKGRTGRLSALLDTRLFDGPSSMRKPTRTIKQGDQVTALMEVRNQHGNLWFVTDQGEWGASSKWRRAPVVASRLAGLTRRKIV